MICKEKNTTTGGARARLLCLSRSPTKSSPPPPTPATSGDLRRCAARARAPHGPRLPPLRPDSPLPSSAACSQREPPMRPPLLRHRSPMAAPPKDSRRGLAQPHPSPSRAPHAIVSMGAQIHGSGGNRQAVGRMSRQRTEK
uniref:Uncharacterized protein n=1 Tax=Aegilops tauschii subsp. strangulata TaxID=200361 RepID=A0A453F1E4_AEGTS